jgi:hypothetical protein
VLHSYWDTDVVVAISPDPKIVASKAMNGITPSEIKAIQQGTLEDWTNEGHQIAVKVVYGQLPAGPMPQLQGPYTATAVNIALVQIRRGGVRLRRHYVAANAPIVREQLQKAGVRLAHVLDAALGK